jgi:multiple sugar transport system permease protein
MATTIPRRAALPHSTAWIQMIAQRALVLLCMALLALIFLVPIWCIVVTSIKPDALAARDMGSALAFFPRFQAPDMPAPEGWWVFENYRVLFERLFVGRMFLNSLIICGGVVIGRLLVDSMAGYALARLRWRGRSILLTIIISSIMLPFEAIAMPLLVLVSKFGWLNSYHGQIIPFISSPLAIFLFYQSFLNVPSELEESARIDGASPFRTFITIVAPMATPAFAAVAILGFLEIWSSFMWPLMITRDFEYRPAILGLFAVFGDQLFWNNGWGQIMAYAALTTVPVLIVFVVFQRWFVQSVARTGLQG